MPPTGSSAALRGTARTLVMPRGQSATVNSASRGPGLTGKPVTESYLRLCVPAQIPADLLGRPLPSRPSSTRARMVLMRRGGPRARQR